MRVSLPGGRSWEPKNYDGRHHGPVLLLDALARSYNLATVQLGLAVGVENIATLLSSLDGGAPVAANPSLLLGALDQSPARVARLYGFLASGGQARSLRVVTGVLDARGRTVAQVRPASSRGSHQAAVALVGHALQEASRAGTGRRIASTPLARFEPAGKTGTSNDGRDSWYAGWTGNLLAVVWVGNDANRALDITGASAALPVWIDLMQRLPQVPLAVDSRAALAWQSIDAEGRALPARCPGRAACPSCPVTRRPRRAWAAAGQCCRRPAAPPGWRAGAPAAQRPP